MYINVNVFFKCLLINLYYINNMVKTNLNAQKIVYIILCDYLQGKYHKKSYRYIFMKKEIFN